MEHRNSKHSLLPGHYTPHHRDIKITFINHKIVTAIRHIWMIVNIEGGFCSLMCSGTPRVNCAYSAEKLTLQGSYASCPPNLNLFVI